MIGIDHVTLRADGRRGSRCSLDHVKNKILRHSCSFSSSNI